MIPLPDIIIRADAHYQGEGLADAVRAYGDARAAEQRERDAQICDGLVFALDHAGNPYRRPANADQCAAAIRAPKEG